MRSHQRHQVVDLTDEPASHNTVPPPTAPGSSSSFFGIAPGGSSHYVGNEFDSSDRAAKRLKYSAPVAVPSTPPGQPTPAHGRDMCSNSSFKGPSIRDINHTLTSNDARVPLLAQVPANPPRALQISRLPQPKTSTAFHTPLQPAAHANPIQVDYGGPQTSTKMQRPAAVSQSVAQSGRAACNDMINYAPATTKLQGDSQPQPAPRPVEADTVASGSLLTHPLVTPTCPPAAVSEPLKLTNQFSGEEDHYLIFLKEVKAYPWRKITLEFNQEFPVRTYPTLQSRYSTVLNRRDRYHDPKILSLPPRFASEAAVDWQTVHAQNPGPRSWGKRNVLQQGSAPTHPRALPPASAQGALSQPFPIRKAVGNGYSSGDSAPRREKSRRAARVDYTSRRKSRRRAEHGGTGDAAREEDAGSNDETEEWATPAAMEERATEAIVSVGVGRDALDIDLAAAADARLAFDMGNPLQESSLTKLPYLSVAQRAAAKEHDLEGTQHTKSLPGCILHVDFTGNELQLVERSIASVIGPASRSRHETRRRQLRERLKDVGEPKLLQLLHQLRRHLRLRDEQSISAFLRDAKAGQIADAPRVQRLAGVCANDRWSTRQFASSSSMLRERELDRQSRRGWRAASRPLTYQVKNKIMDTFGSAASWTGASGDIHAVAWAPDGENFAAAAVAVDDPMSMQYNRPNNLLFGECSQNAIHELGEHYRKREMAEYGPNSTHAMFASQDPKIYNTVSSIGFSRSGNLLYSAGYDGHMCAWYTKIDGSRPRLGAKLNVKAPIDMIAVNPVHDGILAAAGRVSNSKAIRLLHVNEQDPDQFEKRNLHSSKAVSRPDLNILPTAIQFEPRFGDRLLAGFGANARDSGFDTTGDLCVWDVATATALNVHGSSVHVFDVEFNPNRAVMPQFAVGCVAGHSVNRGTRSTVRLYDERVASRFSLMFEIECKALDINDVVWCPYEEHLIAAGCTDGRAYVWDARYEMDPLHVLAHDRSVMPLQEGIQHEQTDTGVRFLAWGGNATRLYSGSSDGVVKVWDVTRSPENAFIKDIFHANTGIMCGAFSPDFSKLVVGEVNGSVNVLEVGRDDCPAAQAARLRHVPYEEDREGQDEDSLSSVVATPDSGVTEARHLLDTGQLQVVPMGMLPVNQVVQGPRYAGPYDLSGEARLLREQASAFQRSMAAVAGGPPCRLPACKDTINKTTMEDTGDSGRSLDRIPDELSRAWNVSEPSPQLVPGKAKCTRCGRAARLSPAAKDARDEASAMAMLCERCAFACLRCGAPHPILPGATRLRCPSCAGGWDLGALGFECTLPPRPTSALGLPVPPLTAWDKAAFWNRLDDDDGHASFGCAMNALSDYYFSLAVDRPERRPTF